MRERKTISSYAVVCSPSYVYLIKTTQIPIKNNLAFNGLSYTCSSTQLPVTLSVCSLMEFTTFRTWLKCPTLVQLDKYTKAVPKYFSPLQIPGQSLGYVLCHSQRTEQHI